MAEFVFTDPQGQEHRITGPEGATKEQAFAKLQEHLGATGGAGESALGGFVGGIPVIGPALKAGAQYAAGGIRSAITGKPFSEELGKVQEYSKRTEAAHPTAETAGEIGGGLYGMGVAGAAAPAAMGLTGTVPQMVAKGAASGAAISAADAAARGENIGTAAVVGTVAGAAGPVVGKLGGALAEPFVTAYRGLKQPELEAARRAAHAVWKDVEARKGQIVQRPEQGLREPQYRRAQVAGQPVMAMDVGGEATRAMARSAANVSPEARQVLNEAINQRYDQQAARLTDWMNSNFHFPDAAKQSEALDQIALKVNRANYQEAFQRGSFDLFATSPKIQQLANSDTVAAAIGAAKKAEKDQRILSSMGMVGAVGKPVAHSGTMDLRFWDSVHKQLQDAAIRAGRGTNEARVIGGFDRELKAELDRLVPSYQTARAGAAGFFKADNALEAGQKALTMKMQNDQIRQGLIKMSPLERQLFQDGYVSRLRETIKEYGYRQNVANKLIFSPAAKERLEIVVGRAKAQELEAFLRVERIMDFARGAVQGGSTTARQLAEIGIATGAAAGTEAYEMWRGNTWSDPGSLAISALAGMLVTKGRSAVVNRIDNQVAIQVAKMLTSPDINQVKRAVTVIANNKALSGALQRADTTIGSIVTRGAIGPEVQKMMSPPPPPQPVAPPEPQYGGPQQ